MRLSKGGITFSSTLWFKMWIISTKKWRIVLTTCCFRLLNNQLHFIVNGSAENSCFHFRLAWRSALLLYTRARARVSCRQPAVQVRPVTIVPPSAASSRTTPRSAAHTPAAGRLVSGSQSVSQSPWASPPPSKWRASLSSSHPPGKTARSPKCPPSPRSMDRRPSPPTCRHLCPAAPLLSAPAPVMLCKFPQRRKVCGCLSRWRGKSPKTKSRNKEEEKEERCSSLRLMNWTASAVKGEINTAHICLSHFYTVEMHITWKLLAFCVRFHLV